MSSVARGGATGFDVPLNLLQVIANQLIIAGSIMGTRRDMEDLMQLVVRAGIKPEIGNILPMDRTDQGFREMWEGKTHGKTVFTR